MAETETERETPVCPHCFRPYEPRDDFCPHCGKPVGEATRQMPFIPPSRKRDDESEDSGDDD